MSELARAADERSGAYEEEHDSNIARDVELVGPRNYIFDAGQSRRIRAELFKVRDARTIHV